MESWSGHAVEVNSYFTVHGQQTFSRHWDNYDFFALQVDGEKEWEIYEPSFRQPLPTHFQDEWDAASLRNCRRLARLTLKKGDLLYVPAGFPHTAKAVPSQDSLHLTVGLMTESWRDIVLALYERAVLEGESELDFRDKIDGTLLAHARKKRLNRHLSDIFRNVPAHLAEMIYSASRTKHRGRSIGDIESLWDSLAMRERLSDKSLMRVRQSYSLRRNSDFVELLCRGKILCFELKAYQSLASIQKRRVFCVADIKLPGKDRRALAQCLCERGILSIERL